MIENNISWASVSGILVTFGGLLFLIVYYVLIKPKLKSQEKKDV